MSATQIVIEDLGSQNGVYVNGSRINGPSELRAGDVLRICTHELELVSVELPPEPEPNRYRITAETFSGSEKATLVDEIRTGASRPPGTSRPPAQSPVPMREHAGRADTAAE